MRCFECFYKCFGRSDSLSTPKGDGGSEPAAVTTTSATTVEEVSVSVASAPASGSTAAATSTPTGQRGRGKVTDAYTLGKVIGSGSYSVVRERAQEEQAKVRHQVHQALRAVRGGRRGHPVRGVHPAADEAPAHHDARGVLRRARILLPRDRVRGRRRAL